MTEATDKQVDFILSLASRLQGVEVRFLSQVENVWMSSKERSGGISKRRASEVIGDLKSQLNNR